MISRPSVSWPLAAVAAVAHRSQALLGFVPARPPFKHSLVWMGLFCVPVMAQDAAVTRALTVVPTFNASTSLASSQGGGDGAELIVRLTPGVQVVQRSGRLQGSLDYALLGTVHSRNAELNTVDHNLSATGKLEAVPGWAYVDARANVGKASLSPFGLQTAPDSLGSNSNQREVLTAYVSPYVRGELLGLAQYELRLRGAGTEMRGTSFGDSNTVAASASLASLGRAQLGWGVNASQERVSFKQGRTTDNSRFGASVNYRPDFDWLVTVSGGQESTNVGVVGGLNNRSYANWGAGLKWTPSARTLVSLDTERRYFGNSHQVVAEHRSRQSALRFSSVRGSTSGADPTGLGQPTTLFQLYMRQFQSVEPDVLTREVRVRELLRLTGQSGNAVVGGGFASSVINLQRREDLTYTYSNPRTTANVQAFASSTSVLDGASPAANALGLGDTRQVGVMAGLAHRTTPQTSVNLTASMQRSTSEQTASAANLKSLTVGATTNVNRTTSASLALRHSISGGNAITSNRETALTASLSTRF